MDAIDICNNLKVVLMQGQGEVNFKRQSFMRDSCFPIGRPLIFFWKKEEEEEREPFIIHLTFLFNHNLPFFCHRPSPRMALENWPLFLAQLRQMNDWLAHQDANFHQLKGTVGGDSESVSQLINSFSVGELSPDITSLDHALLQLCFFLTVVDRSSRRSCACSVSKWKICWIGGKCLCEISLPREDMASTQNPRVRPQFWKVF